MQYVGSQFPNRGVEPTPFALGARSLNHWTAREGPLSVFQGCSSVTLSTFPVLYTHHHCPLETEAVHLLTANSPLPPSQRLVASIFALSVTLPVLGPSCKRGHTAPHPLVSGFLHLA